MSDSVGESQIRSEESIQAETSEAIAQEAAEKQPQPGDEALEGPAQNDGISQGPEKADVDEGWGPSPGTENTPSTQSWNEEVKEQDLPAGVEKKEASRDRPQTRDPTRKSYPRGGPDRHQRNDFPNPRQRSDNFRYENNRHHRNWRGGPRIRGRGGEQQGFRDPPRRNSESYVQQHRRGFDGPGRGFDQQYFQRGHGKRGGRKNMGSFDASAPIDKDGQDEPQPDPNKQTSLYESIHAPKVLPKGEDNTLKTTTPYVNKDRVLSGGVNRKKDEEEVSELMARMRVQNEKLIEKRKIVEQDAEMFRKEEEERKNREAKNQEIQRQKMREEEEERKRHEQQQRRLQNNLDTEREANARLRTENRESREWDKEKQDQNWNHDRPGRDNQGPRGNRAQRGYRTDGNEFPPRNYQGRGNEYPRRNNRGGGRQGGSRGRGRRYNNKYLDSAAKEANNRRSWADEQELEENGVKAKLPWDEDGDRRDLKGSGPPSHGADNRASSKDEAWKQDLTWDPSYTDEDPQQDSTSNKNDDGAKPKEGQEEDTSNSNATKVDGWAETPESSNDQNDWKKKHELGWKKDTPLQPQQDASWKD